MLMNKEQEEKVQVSCEIDEELDRKIKLIKHKRGRQSRWLIRMAMEGFIRGDIEV